MIDDLKTGLKLLKFSYNLKTYIVLGIVFVVLGCVILFLGGGDMYWGKYAGLLAMAGGLFPAQMLYSLAVSNMVLASPMRKKLQTKIPVFCSLVMQTGVYLVVALVRGIQGMKNPALLPFASSELQMLGVFGAILVVYGVISFKYYWRSTILFCFAYPVAASCFQGEIDNPGSSMVPFGVSLPLGLVVMVIAAFVAYGLSLWAYKKPVSKMSQSAALREYM